MSKTFKEIAHAKRWTQEQQIEILLEYIGNQSSDDAFQDFLLEQQPTPESELEYYVMGLYSTSDGGTWCDTVTCGPGDDPEDIAKEIMTENEGVDPKDVDEFARVKEAITIVECSLMNGR